MSDVDTDARRHLARHFFAGLFDLGDLSGGGVSSLPRTVAGVCAVFLGVGVLMARVFLRKYRDLGNWPSPEPYLQAVVADHAFLIAVPMWVIAIVTVLVSPSLFPDETDFRVLMPLPLTRRVVFGAKVIALARFLGVFVVASHAALLFMVALTANSPWAIHSFPKQLAAWLVASLLASTFAAMAVAAVRALLLLAVPRERALPISAALSSVMLFGLVAVVPLMAQLAGADELFSQPPWWLALVPPAWFSGIEQLLLGDALSGYLALSGAAALAVAAAAAVGGYVVLYRHFDRVMLRAAAKGAGATTPDASRSRRREPGRPAYAAVRDFTTVTLRRSVLHQGLVATIAAIGAAVVSNVLIGADFVPERVSERLRLEETIAWAPFVLIFATTLAVRASLLVPIELRANWIFRVTDQPSSHRDQLGAAVGVVRFIGVVVPVAVMLPLQWFVVGTPSIGMAVVTVACGLLFVEIVMATWRRVPFTCSYIAGKGFVPQLLIVGLCAFWLFTSIGTGLARLPLKTPEAALIWTGILAGVTLVLRQFRLRAWQRDAIEFEDSLPSEANALRLSSD